MRFYIIILVSIMLGSCYTKKQAIRKFCIKETTVIDSVDHQYSDTKSSSKTSTDNSVLQPATESNITIPNPCDSLGFLRKFYISSSQGKNKTTVESNGNEIKVHSDCEASLQRFKHDVDSLIEKTKEHNTQIHTEYETKTIEVKFIPWWIKSLLLLTTILSIPTLFKIAKFILLKVA